MVEDEREPTASGNGDSSVARLSSREPAEGAKVRYPGLGAMFLFWTAIGAFTSARYHLLPSSHAYPGGLATILACVVCFYPWTGLTPLLFRLEARFPLDSGRWPRNLAVLALASVPLSLLAAPLMLAFAVAVPFVLRAPVWVPPSAIAWFGDLPVALAIFWCSVAAGYFFRTLFRLREQERRAARLALEKAQLEAGLNQAQLEVVRARLNPHFLFNSLHNISVMTREDPQTASRMLTRLGDLLRAVLRQDSRPESTLREEIALTRAYVALEQMRFGDRLHVGFEVAPEAQEALVPSFLLQPLIENAVVHGLRGSGKTGVITVSACPRQGELVLTVADNGIGPPAQDGAELKVGVGLGSTRERLARMYPNHHAFTLGKQAEGGAEVRIAIPLRLAAEEDRHYGNEEPARPDR